MKVYKFFVVTLVMIFILQSNMFSQQRKAVFIHGFMGDKSTWSNASELKSGYKHIPQSWVNEGIIDAYSIPKLPSIVEPDVYETIVKNSTRNLITSDNTKLFLVGHSMGGLVARDVENDIRNDYNLKGIITLGTPHQGATIANNIDKIPPTLDKVKGKMLEGPDWQSGYGYLGILTPTAPIELFLSFGSSIGYGILDFAFNIAKIYISNIKNSVTPNKPEELAPNSSFIRRINSKPAVVPHLAAGGIENNNSLIRLAGKSDESSAINNFTDVVNAVRTVRNYHESYNRWYVQAFLYPVWLLHHEGLVYWNRSLGAVQNIDKTWGSLHNTVVTETKSVTYRIWVSCENDPDDDYFSINDLEVLFERYNPCKYGEGASGYFDVRSYTYTVTYTDKSDGFIPLSKTKWNSGDEIIKNPSLASASQMRQASVSFDGSGEQEGGYNHMEVRYPVRSYGSKSKTKMANFTKGWAEWWLTQ